ncbi:MAG: PBP1A family penicillin-binding protein [Firmicutes bacterium]|nr:PBP1A family penicillin-binding protein [Bacillota bacterium]
MGGRSKRRKRRLLFITVFIISILAGAGLGVIAGFLKSAPSLADVEFAPRLTTYVYDANGEVLTRFFTENRVEVSIDQMPRFLHDAILAAEDDGFYEHYGIDFKAVVRAIIADIRAGAKVQGASTITMQLARTAFLTQKKLWTRKLQEVLWAIQIERKYSKEEILEAYLNIINFGHGAYGVQAASEMYFGKSVEDLTLAEAALLAAIPKSPVYLSPISYPEAALNRRNWILGRMADLGYITREEAEASKATPIQLVERKPREKVAPYFIDYVLQELLERYGEDLVYGGGLKVYTTLDLSMQRIAEETLLQSLPNGRVDRNGLQQPQGALVAIDPRNGHIKAMVGGRGDDKFNRAVLAKRQPGSAMKPFIYTVAIEKGYTPATIMVDEPIEYVMPNGQTWAPQNYHRDYRGPITLREALELSINIVAVKLLDEVGIRDVVDLAKKMGITTLVEEGRYNDLGLAPLALGGLTHGVTLLEMASAYGVFANQGVRVPPVAIVKVVDADGNVLEEHKPQGQRVISEQTAYIMNDMLKGVVERGTGRQAAIGRPAAGKTGTAQNYTNGWFIGYTPSLVTAVWMGDDEQSQEMVYKGVRYGSWNTAEMWSEFMRRVLKDKPVEDFPKPEGIVDGILIDTKTGLLARNNGTIPESEMRYEIFIEGTEPKEYSPRVKTLFDHLRELFTPRPREDEPKAGADIEVPGRPISGGGSLSASDEGQRTGDGPLEPLVQQEPVAPSWIEEPEVNTEVETAPAPEERPDEQEIDEGAGVVEEHPQEDDEKELLRQLKEAFGL